MNTVSRYMENWAFSIGVLAGALVVGVVVHWLVVRVVSRFARRGSESLEASLLRHGRGPSRVLFPLMFLYLSLPALELPPKADTSIGSLVSALLIGSGAWLLVRLTNVLEDMVLERYDITRKDNLQARKVYTQFRIIKKVIIVTVVVVAAASVLMGFEKFRRLGTGLLASAGVAGLVVGLAAKSTLGNLLAGIQIAVSQPIRLDDVVIVEGEWGWIEEIALTYVVVRIWDLRRLVLPISYFIEKPFQNWTRVSANLLGTVYLYMDYTVPVEEVRRELKRILEASPLWDRKAWTLQVTDATDRAVVVRALMSATDSTNAWNLRCEVREKLISFVQEKYPHALPKMRAAVQEAPRTEAAESDA
jgi:small-conductance mechanosensitive channel